MTAKVVVAGALVTAAVATALTSPAIAAAAPTWRVNKTFDYAPADSANGVVAFGRNNAWSFGGSGIGDRMRPLALHWNGRSWQRTALPGGLKGWLWNGAASSPTNLWALSSAGELGSGPEAVLRWNGRKWTVMKRNFPGHTSGLTVLGPKNVWVFGGPGADSGSGTWHYNGNRWTKVDTPKIWLSKASAVSAKDIWATGRDMQDDSRVVARHNGRSWRVVSLRHLLPKGFNVRDIHAESARSVWATACRFGQAGNRGSVLLHWNGQKWWKSAAQPGHCLNNPTPDGRGGLWLTSWMKSGDNERTVLRHRSKAGKWSTGVFSGAGARTPDVNDLALIPGTKSLWGAGELKIADWNSSGAIFRFDG